MKCFYDLTRTLHTGIAVYPGTPAPVVEQVNSIEEDGYRETAFRIQSHVGTHIDAPSHMLRSGTSLDCYTVDRFFGTGFVVDLSSFKAGQAVDPDALSLFERQSFSHCEFVLFNTGFDDDQDPYRQYAVPSEELLNLAIRNGLRSVGIDRMSIDAMDSADMALHRLLFAHDVLIIENLQGLSKLKGKVFEICTLPLLYKDADGAPARVVAVVE